MTNRLLIAYCAFALGLSIELCHAQTTRPKPPLQTSGKLLSVEDTILLATRVYAEGPTISDRDLMAFGNPDARPELYRILDDPTRQDVWKSVLFMIGRIGTEEDVLQLQKVLLNLRGVSPGVRGATSGVRGAIEMLRERKVPGAKEAILEMSLPTYWSSMQYETVERRDPNYFTFPTEQAYHTVWATGEDIGLTRTQMFERLLERTPDRQQRSIVIEWVNQRSGRQLIDPKRWLVPSTVPTESTN